MTTFDQGTIRSSSPTDRGQNSRAFTVVLEWLTRLNPGFTTVWMPVNTPAGEFTERLGAFTRRIQGITVLHHDSCRGPVASTAVTATK